jgi:hypothetical protein
MIAWSFQALSRRKAFKKQKPLPEGEGFVAWT